MISNRFCRGRHIFSSKGFTLIELLVAISIIGILSSVILIGLQSSRDKATMANALTFATANYRAFGAGALAVYNFDEASGDAHDSSGNNFTATLENCSPSTCRLSDTPTGTGNSLSLFSGNKEYAEYASANNMTSSPISQMTVSAWVKPIDLVDFRPIVMVSRDQNNTRDMYIDLRGDGLHVDGNGCPGSGYDVSGVISPGKWYNIAFSINTTGTGNLYVNGKLIGTIQCAPFSQFYPHDIAVGRATIDGKDYYYSGLMDDVDIYTQALAYNQIQEQYAEGLSTHRDLAEK